MYVLWKGKQHDCSLFTGSVLYFTQINVTEREAKAEDIQYRQKIAAASQHHHRTRPDNRLTRCTRITHKQDLACRSLAHVGIALAKWTGRFYSVPDSGAEYCDDRVCLSVRKHISGSTRPIFTKFFMRITYGSVHLWRCSDTLCTSGFMDCVTLARKAAWRRRLAEA